MKSINIRNKKASFNYELIEKLVAGIVLKGTEIKQRIQKLTVEASGIYSPAWGDKNIGLPFAKGGTAGYLNSRYFTIYGGASEVQKDVVAKKVLGLTKGSSK